MTTCTSDGWNCCWSSTRSWVWALLLLAPLLLLKPLQRVACLCLLHFRRYLISWLHYFSAELCHRRPHWCWHCLWHYWSTGLPFDQMVGVLGDPVFEWAYFALRNAEDCSFWIVNAGRLHWFCDLHRIDQLGNLRVVLEHWMVDSYHLSHSFWIDS